MSYCVICYESINESYTCSMCLNSSCINCATTFKKCCFCGYEIDRVKREISYQLSLIDIEYKQDDTNEIIKPCPVCNTFIEKHSQDCMQMYCTVCSTAWMWNTSGILKPRLKDIHNPHFTPKKYLVVDPLSSDSLKLACKSLNRLAGEEYKYAVDMFTIRTLYAAKETSFSEFCERVTNRFKINDRLMAIKRILKKYVEGAIDISSCNRELSIYDLKLEKGQLPYT